MVFVHTLKGLLCIILILYMHDNSVLGNISIVTYIFFSVFYFFCIFSLLVTPEWIPLGSLVTLQISRC